jgi:hypothetical protein
MKPLAANDLISMLPAEPDFTERTLLRFESLTPTVAREPGEIVRWIQSGGSKPVVVSVNNVPAYLLCYRVTGDGGLFVDIAQTLDSSASISALNEAVGQLETQHAVRYTRFLTKRAGLAKIAETLGFTPEAILLTRER